MLCLLGLSMNLNACANSSIGKALENSIKPDPQLEENPPFSRITSQPDSTPEPVETEIQLPDDFPTEIPLYPDAKLQEISASETTWQTADPVNLVQRYYQQELKTQKWEVIDRPTNEGEGNFIAEKGDLKITISLNPDQKSGSKTQFKMDYTRSETVALEKPESKVDVSPSPLPPPPDLPLPPAAVFTPKPTPDATGNSTQESATISPDSSEEITNKENNSIPEPIKETETEKTEKIEPVSPPIPSNQAPSELSQFVTDIAQLQLFQASDSPNQVMTRAEYAQALVKANNTFYADRSAKQIRLGVETDKPVFTDVPPSHPDFSAIQGLAEAGLIPSTLSGESTVVKFRPEAPLTREDLILWKVPLDTRQALPKATVDAVQERWGFQDTAKIETKALQAVLADFDNGDNSNIRRVFGFTTLFRPKESVTQAEAAATLWYFGFQGDGISAEELLQDQ